METVMFHSIFAAPEKVLDGRREAMLAIGVGSRPGQCNNAMGAIPSFCEQNLLRLGRLRCANSD
jgi:hypothetical protein